MEATEILFIGIIVLIIVLLIFINKLFINIKDSIEDIIVKTFIKNNYKIIPYTIKDETLTICKHLAAGEYIVQQFYIKVEKYEIWTANGIGLLYVRMPHQPGSINLYKKDLDLIKEMLLKRLAYDKVQIKGIND